MAGRAGCEKLWVSPLLSMHARIVIAAREYAEFQNAGKGKEETCPPDLAWRNEPEGIPLVFERVPGRMTQTTSVRCAKTH
jgi:hypothetical protein